MELEKLVWNSRKYDCYKNCLSKEQTDVLDLFLLKGLQITEIAELKKTSRQAVSKTVKTALDKLDELENNIHFLQFQTNLQDELKKLEKIAQKGNKEELLNKLANLKRRYDGIF